MATTQQVYDPISAYPTRNLVVNANGGSVTIESQVEGVWIVTDTVTTTSANQVFQGINTLRITPIDGATFEYQ